MKAFRFYVPSRLVTTILVAATTLSILVAKVDVSRLAPNDPRLRDLLIYTRIISVPFLLALLIGVLEKWAWRWPMFRWISRVPDLSGRYVGRMVSSFLTAQGDRVEKDCAFEVSQTASSLAATLYLRDKEHSRETVSRSIVADIIVREDGFVDLVYVYFNRQGPLAPGGPQDHPGTALLRFIPNPRGFRGEYFNRRRNVGELELRFAERTLHGCYE
jgi:SMODS-associating 2TM, beta-strand rich effector domain